MRQQKCKGLHMGVCSVPSEMSRKSSETEEKGANESMRGNRTRVITGQGQWWQREVLNRRRGPSILER